MSSFIRGTAILMIAVFFSKLFGFVFRIQFMRIAGEEAVGIYMTAYPAFIFFLSLVQLGIPLALAKIIAELHTKRDKEKIFAVMKTAYRLTISMGIIFIPLSLLFIPFLAERLLGNSSTSMALYVGVCIIPIAAFGGLIRGYFQGITQIEQTAWSQIIEQICRISLITWLLPMMLSPSNDAANAAYVMGITLLAEVLSVVYLYIKYKQSTRRRQRSVSSPYPSKPILAIALPASGSRLFGTFTWFLEPIIFIRALALSGISATMATSLYGIISGVLVPLLLFPAFIPYALSVVLVPAVSSAVAARNSPKLQERIHLALRLSALTGAFAAAVFYLHGQALAERLFHTSTDSDYMKILAPVFFFYYIQGPLYAILQATNEAKAGMLNSIYGGIAKLGVMFILASQPGLQEAGAVLAIGFGVLITSFLHIATIRQNKQLATGFTLFALPYTCFLMTIIMRPIFFPFQTDQLILHCLQTIAFLFVLLLFMRQIKITDFALLRKLLHSSH